MENGEATALKISQQLSDTGEDKRFYVLFQIQWESNVLITKGQSYKQLRGQQETDHIQLFPKFQNFLSL